MHLTTLLWCHCPPFCFRSRDFLLRDFRSLDVYLTGSHVRGSHVTGNKMANHVVKCTPIILLRFFVALLTFGLLILYILTLIFKLLTSIEYDNVVITALYKFRIFVPASHGLRSFHFGITQSTDSYPYMQLLKYDLLILYILITIF